MCLFVSVNVCLGVQLYVYVTAMFCVYVTAMFCLIPNVSDNCKRVFSVCLGVSLYVCVTAMFCLCAMASDTPKCHGFLHSMLLCAMVADTQCSASVPWFLSLRNVFLTKRKNASENTGGEKN